MRLLYFFDFVEFVTFEQKSHLFCRTCSSKNAENEKNTKKLLTKFSFSGKIYKLPQESRCRSFLKREKNLKKVEKTFKKGIDKRERVWYNNQAVAQSDGE